ncbi:YceI family protein [Aciditerrimonas ferrireducens]|uniref:YceI family protein n=1 Tax=Aciditerrimonas ferrireducens TaxID=667306 RepID=UPI00200461FB|nr:YceI family protein [Aciditerrimonas ferrireducens]MCK4176735.1 YceI family protein [Aciditerrimonas ferrireducens]
MSRWTVDAEASRIRLEGKSSLHAIHGSLRPGSLRGELEAELDGKQVDLRKPVGGELRFPVTALSFGNAMYDRELPKRLDVTRHPDVVVALERAEGADEGSLALELRLSVQGTTVTFPERVEVAVVDEDTLEVRGSHRFDVRELGIEPPKMLGMKVHPDFTVQVDLTARRVKT